LDGRMRSTRCCWSGAREDERDYRGSKLAAAMSPRVVGARRSMARTSTARYPSAVRPLCSRFPPPIR
jgi:hypothetical protein